MRRAYRFQLRPTTRQQTALVAMLADHCTLYNAALQERRDAYRHPSRTRIRYGAQSAQLSAIRAEVAEQARWSFSSQQATLRRLDKAYAAFFRRVKAGQTPGYPRFRSSARFDTVEFPKDGDGCRWAALPKSGSSTWTHVYLQGVGHVKVNQHRAVAGQVKTIAVKREGSRARPRWYVVLSCDDVPAQPLPATGRVVGLDLATGANGLAYTSEGQRLDNPRAYRQIEVRLANAQQLAAATRPRPFQRASIRHKQALDRIRRLHAKAARIRADHHHKTALDIVRRYDVIAHEALAPANMTRRARPKPATDDNGTVTFLPNSQHAKTALNKSILDAGWTQFLAILTAKAECAGRQTIAVNPAGTSQTCHHCGTRDPAARRGKIYTCTHCERNGDADINAARNILRAGLALLDAA